ncbi:Bet v1-like protein [Microthyrium microscopicum]|uniref:Bet v1-like protein n=1 Tax=Microthyrium microscopicum TaxID=703497 RepID=A0A6A6TVA4_9PEZI|nr:Bet v1-like protein [Microthyrium microscopicum]
MSVPTSSGVRESAVIAAPLAKVWHLIKLNDFPTFWSRLDKSEVVKGTSPETDVVKWAFKDGTVLEIKQEEHSSLDHFITYSVITAQPALTYTSVVSTIRLYPITTGKNEGHTFIVWTGNFSSDASADVIEDAKYKRQEALADLAKKLEK